MLRRLRGWRLTWHATSNSATPTRQFQIADAMLWTLLVSGSLGAMKLLHAIDQEIGDPYLDIVVYIAESTSIVLLAIVVAFARRWTWKASVAVAVAVLAIGAASGIPEIWRILDRWISNSTTRVTAARLVESVCRQVFEHDCGAVSTFTASLVNCLVLRRVECKLVRQAVRNRSGRLW